MSPKCWRRSSAAWRLAVVSRETRPLPEAPRSRRAHLAEALARRRACLAEALARRRVPLGFAFGALVLWLAQPTMVSLSSGTAVAVIGESLRIWAAGHLNKSREVTTSGPYRWFAHPLYVGSSIMGVGLAIASGSVPAAMLIVVYLGLTIAAAVTSEERFLRQRFGDMYDRYRSVRKDDTDQPRRRFSLGLARRNREYRAAFGLAIAVLLLLAKAAWSGR
jgi:protein-S-isoprenylcysteine O-methyltransferase Ste14